MLKNENIICISSIDWDFIWQGHQQIMSTLAENGNRVLFIENTGVRTPRLRDIPRIKSRIKNWFLGVSGIRQEGRNLYIFSPLVLPFPYLRIAKWVNRYLTLSILNKWMKIMNFGNPIIWTFLPTPLSLDIIGSLNSKIIIYYCIDNFRASSSSAKKIRRSEINLLKKVDLVFVTSRELYEYCSRYNDKVNIFPFAVDFKEFERARLDKNHAIDEFKNIKRPVIGYIGGVHKWIDLSLLKKSAQMYPQYSFVFIGPIQTDISLLSGMKNIYFLGKKDHKEIPNFINNFDICVIPYLISEYTKNVYPTKLNEYHALGKPVVSTNLPEIINFNKENDNLVFIGKNHEEFIDCISKALKNNSDSLVSRRISSAKKNNWAVRIEEMSNLIGDVIRHKSGMSFDWQRGLMRLYKAAQRRFLGVVFLFLTAYFLVFCTPLVWYLANPLQILQAPRTTDCIVVFAGGVGESGRAGQGYEERVQYAVDLYNKGYAKNLIFSSGFLYAFKEPLIMKALAVSLGIPEGAIILEDNSHSTYQNVKFSKEILDKNNWSSILLVSSPYHMRRVSLVFNKFAKEIKVYYTPIPRSRFYLHEGRDSYGRRVWRQINLQQIRSILHEYLGILYYWWKGYI